MPLRSLRRGAVYGNYVPALSAVSNLDAAPVPLNAFWRATGDLVTVNFAVDVDPSAGTGFVFRMSLPFSPVFTDEFDIIGVCGVPDAGGFGGTVRADLANQQARVDSSSGADVVAQCVGEFSFIVR